MNPCISEFLNFLENENDIDYGDFKREVDSHLLKLGVDLTPLTTEQLWRLRKLREQLLWTYCNDVGEMQSLLRAEINALSDYTDHLVP